MIPTRTREAALLAALLLASCGGGGGPGRGATTISGNVRSATPVATSSASKRSLWAAVVRWWQAEVAAQVPGITVSVINTTGSDETDAAGFFQIDSRDFGPATIRFSGQGVDASLGVVLPAGGDLQLVNVDLDGLNLTIEEQRIHFTGPITAVDCTARLLQVLSGERIPFRVHLESRTALLGPNGEAIACSDLILGREAEVQALVNSGNDLRAVALQQKAGSSSAPAPVEFTGLVTATDCPTQIAVNRDGSSTIVSIGPSTQIHDVGGEALSCAAFHGGDLVRVQGSENAFGVQADAIDRLAQPTPSPTPSGTPTP